jgi:DICT domain-containing protein
MKEFSIYDFAFNSAGEKVEDLGTVTHISRRDFGGHTTFRFRAQVPALEYISLLIENGLLLRTHRGGRLFAGFQKLSRMEPVVDRYMRIADVSERVYVFGEPDWKPPRHPNMRVIPLAEGITLAREWFVIADSPNMRVALIGVDEGDSDTPVHEERTFRAFKTSDPALVERLAAAADALVDEVLPA